MDTHLASTTANAEPCPPTPPVTMPTELEPEDGVSEENALFGWSHLQAESTNLAQTTTQDAQSSSDQPTTTERTPQEADPKVEGNHQD